MDTRIIEIHTTILAYQKRVVIQSNWHCWFMIQRKTVAAIVLNVSNLHKYLTALFLSLSLSPLSLPFYCTCVKESNKTRTHAPFFPPPAVLNAWLKESGNSCCPLLIGTASWPYQEVLEAEHSLDIYHQQWLHCHGQRSETDGEQPASKKQNTQNSIIKSAMLRGPKKKRRESFLSDVNKIETSIPSYIGWVLPSFFSLLPFPFFFLIQVSQAEYYPSTKLRCVVFFWWPK